MKHARKDYQRFQDPLPEYMGGIPPDEPVFLLRAKDITAPGVVRYWALVAKRAGANDKIIEAALGQAQAMANWQKEHGSQVPDMPEDA
jgi:hypothetical protein